MKNILNIIRHDSGKLTSSVVAIITIMGLCIIPCLYAWFNIFSNWAPYDADATGRILVAVANEDRGSEMMGLKVRRSLIRLRRTMRSDGALWTIVKMR